MADKDIEYRSAFKGEAMEIPPTPGFHTTPNDKFQMLNLYNASGLIAGDYDRRAKLLVLEQFKGGTFVVN